MAGFWIYFEVGAIGFTDELGVGSLSVERRVR